MPEPRNITVYATGPAAMIDMRIRAADVALSTMSAPVEVGAQMHTIHGVADAPDVLGFTFSFIDDEE